MLVSAATPLGLRARAVLAGEILLAYLRARRELRRAPIAAVVAQLRDEDDDGDGCGGGSGGAGGRPGMRADVAPATLEQALRLSRAVVAMLSLLPGDTRCLVRSLVLTRLLARRGIDTRLVIAARSAPDFLAHAWVECAGAPLLQPGDDSFGRLVEL